MTREVKTLFRRGNEYEVICKGSFNTVYEVCPDQVLYGRKLFEGRIGATEAYNKMFQDYNDGKYFIREEMYEEDEEFILFALVNVAENQEILGYGKHNNVNDVLFGYDFINSVQFDASEVVDVWNESENNPDWYLVAPHKVILRKVTKKRDGVETIDYYNDYSGICVRSEQWTRK